MTTIKEKPLLVIVTGMSGAGRSVVTNCLEDLNFHCIDNLPTALIKPMADFMLQSEAGKHFALGMDVRDKKFANSFSGLLDWLNQFFRVDLLFLTADDDTLSTRYSSTRRRHPLIEASGDLAAAFSQERQLMEPIRKLADGEFDTSTWSPHYLARQIEQRYGDTQTQRNLHVTISSFGFKYGHYRNADEIFDVRCFSNPHFVPELKDKTGMNQTVADFIFADPGAKEFLDRLVDLHSFLLPLYYNEGKNYFRIGIGCTGGKHRSVAISEALARMLTEQELPNILITVTHRDLAEFSPLVQR